MLTSNQINHLAKLSKLDLTEEEKKQYAEQISSVLFYFKQLEEVDVSKVEATDHITGLQDVVREDEVKLIYSEEKVLGSAPELADNQVRVAAVFEK